MYLTDLVRRALRSLWSAKTRTLLTALAIAVGTFALTLTLGASNGAQNYADTLVKNNFDPSELIVSADRNLFDRTDTSRPQVAGQNTASISFGGGSSRQVKQLTDTDLERLAALPGVESVRPALSVSLAYLTRDGQKRYSASAQPYSAYRNPELLAGRIPTPLAAHTVVLPEAWLAALGFADAPAAVGQPVRLGVRRQVDQSALISAFQSGGLAAAAGQLGANSTEETFTVAAVMKKPSTFVQPGTELSLLIPTADAIHLNDYTTEGTISYHKYLSAYVKVTGGTDSAKLSAAQSAVTKAGYGARSVKDTQETLTQIITVLQGIVMVFGLIAVVASVFGVINTMYISVLQRTREIGLMKALGMRKRDITRLFRLEAGLLGLLGGLIGAATAVILGTLLNPWIATQLGLGGTNLMQFHYDQIGLLILALIIIATLAGLMPARKASRLDPIAALRTE